VELVAHNEVTEVNLTLAVWVERPLGGLLVLPHPTSRVLMNSVLVSGFGLGLGLAVLLFSI
jgi:hypothetical protein